MKYFVLMAVCLLFVVITSRADENNSEYEKSLSDVAE